MSQNLTDAFPDFLDMPTEDAMAFIKELRNGRSKDVITNIAKHEARTSQKVNVAEKSMAKLSTEQLRALIAALGGNSAPE